MSQEKKEHEQSVMKKKRKYELMEPANTKSAKKLKRRVSSYVDFTDQCDVDEPLLLQQQRNRCENEGVGKENV